MEKLHIKKNTVQETLMLPLYGRAVWAKRAPQTLPDPEAQRLCDAVDYDFNALKLPGFAPLVWAVRQLGLCEAAQSYLAEHPKATVVDLGCGLATEFYQVDNGLCQWVNIDLPDVIDLRNQLLPPRDRERNIACPGGAVFFDAENSQGVKTSNKAVIKKSGNEGALMKFAVNDPKKTFAGWSSAFASVRKVGMPTKALASKEIGTKDKMILRASVASGTMKFVEIRFA